MGISFKKEILPDDTDWKLILAYIGAKQTHDPAFRDLFNSVLNDNGHPCHLEVKTLSMLYDFTPIQQDRVPE